MKKTFEQWWCHRVQSAPGHMIGNISVHIEKDREESGCLPLCRMMQYPSAIWTDRLPDLAPIYRLSSLYKPPFLSLQHVEKRWANFDTAIKRGQGIHVFVWNKHLEILLHCWVIWKVAELPPPPPPLRCLILATHFGVWRLNLTFPLLGESPNLGATRGGGGLGYPLSGFPQTQGSSFLSRSS